MSRLFLGLAAGLSCSGDFSAPYEPKDDAAVLERLPLRPGDPAPAELRRLRGRPDDPSESKLWVLTRLAELAWRLGEAPVAERHLLAARDAEAAGPALAWLESSGFESERLRRLAAQLKAPR